MRRMPYILVKESRIEYVCSNCRRIIPRDLYIKSDYCPSCDKFVNKYANKIIQVYKVFDKEMLNFININRR